ncbi:MAG: tRNA nucleotidyltransferase [Ignavibacteria bacterium GWA2_55_11]|nr:MAG: tRNA nucleotidyltransferase [Ignavibacteria bacterium GWA2_55_11]OGU71333.1 MAG: tRNA nucleotidyltransferase [Ignavibacteria bacterium RIFCSPLOWO2_12_FULL_56_21]OGU75566.1 MAG: tRNA nucleotidyltransferase [Ignavibacteria bacterium RIFCSPLOWO2_02_FULL_55_14]
MAVERFDVREPLLVELGALADRTGARIAAVGGYVRDVLLGRDGKDIDIVVLGDGVAFAREAARRLRAGDPVVFEKFGTAMVHLGDRKVEFVGARKESYARDSRKPVVDPGTIEEDLARRDFTVNAIAVWLNKADKGTIVDPFQGRDDLGRRILKTPRDPKATFDDDPLRIMRAMRFAAQLDFDVDPQVLAAAKSMRERLGIVSQERIAEEFLKLMQAPRPSVGLSMMFETGVMDVVFPEGSRLAGVEQRQEYHHKDVLRHTLKVVDNICEMSDNVWLRMAALLHDIAKPKTKAFKEGIGWTFHGHEELGARMVPQIFRRMKFPLTYAPYVEKLVRLHLRPMALVDSEVTDSAVRRLMFDAGDEVDDLMLLCRADITSKNPQLVERVRTNYDLVIKKMAEVETRDRIRSWQPPLRGEEIMEICKFPAGPIIGVLKDAITDAILDGKIPNEHDAAVAFLMSQKDAIVAGATQDGTVKKTPREDLFRGKTIPPPGNAKLS